MFRFSKKLFSNIKIKLPKTDLYLVDNYPLETETNKEELVRYLKELTYMRRMEINSDIMYKNKEIRGFCHLYDGQEAIAMGLEEGINKQDCIITAYRNHCQAYLRGISIFQIFTEMLGKEGGSSKGKGGSMHFYNSDQNYYGGNGIVGAQISVGTGIGFALKYKNQQNVSITMYGDGAANQGQNFESVNMAKLWKLPVIYICENNEYSMGTSLERSTYNSNFHSRFNGIPGIECDGLNLFAVRETIKYAKDFALKNGPIILNIKTYRYHGHSMSDPGISYRTREEVQDYRKNKDCISYIKNLILENNLLEEKEIKNIEKTIKKEVDEIMEKARSQKDISINNLLEDVYEKEIFFKRAINYEDSVFVKENLVE